MKKKILFTIQINSPKKKMTDYESVRQQKIDLIRNQYQKTLNDYIRLYNMNLTTPNSISNQDIVDKNNQLISIVLQLKANNEFTESEINSIYQNISTDQIAKVNKSIQDQVNALIRKNEKLTTHQAMTDQYKTDYRRYQLIYLFNVFLLIAFLISFCFIAYRYYDVLKNHGTEIREKVTSGITKLYNRLSSSISRTKR